MIRNLFFDRWPIFSILAGWICCLASGGVARAGSVAADSIALNFSSLSPSASVNTIEGDSYTKISGLMNQADISIATFIGHSLPAGAAVTVKGALIQSTYDGEGHVVGPTYNHTVVPWTLGDTGYSGGHLSKPSANPIYSSFLTNAGFPYSRPVSTGITMTFSHYLISKVSFTFEIFPDGTGNIPDLTFSGSKDGKAISLSSVTATTYNGSPYIGSFGTNNDSWTALGVRPNVYTTSHNSSRETSLQLLGTASFVFSSPVNALSFQDWPALIGINDLELTPPEQPHVLTPAPRSAVLFGLGVLILGGCWVRRGRPLRATSA